MEKRVYIHAPELPNTQKSLERICNSLVVSGLAKESLVVICCSLGYSSRISSIFRVLPNHVIR